MPFVTRESVGKYRMDASIEDKVRVSFLRSSHNPERRVLNISIGRVIAKRLGWAAKDRVAFAIWEDDVTGQPDYCVYLLKKQPMGFKLSEVGKALRVQITWKEDVIPDKTVAGNVVFASYDIYEGGLRVMVPGYRKESVGMHS